MSSQHRFQVVSPVDQSVYIERDFATEEQTAACLERTAAAAAGWQRTPLSERMEICRAAVGYFLEHADVIGEELTWQMGRPVRYTPLEIRRGFQDRAHYMTGQAEEALATLTMEDSARFHRFVRRVPLGTVLVLAPWNYPYLTSVNVVIPALLAGNTVVLKHAQQTPLCAERYAAAFRHAGLPEGVFEYLHLTHAQTARVIADRRIAQVAFTGSVEGGAAVQRAIGGRFIAAGLELGGKDPAYVRPDADLDHAVAELVDGAFFNSGQSCCGIERIYVDKALYADFVERFVERTKTYVLDNPLLPSTTLGPMVRRSAADQVRAQVAEALSKGARALVDPGLFPAAQPEGAYLAPQVLVDVHHGMTLMREETFGPVVGIMPVADDAEAVGLMNDSRYGLTASIWTRDADAALRLGEQLETGTCFLNRCDYLDPALAWTGVKDSGRGCTLSNLGFESLTRPMSFHFKKAT
jgi:acyl-CoA reductase-like NAD-dependent aldehyde dehydrogenase